MRFVLAWCDLGLGPERKGKVKELRDVRAIFGLGSAERGKA